MSDFRQKICSHVIKSALLSPDGQLEELFWKNFHFFLTFFGLPAIISYFFRCIIPGMVVQTEFHQPRGTYPLLKIFVRKLFVLSGLWALFWNFIEVFLAFCQNYSLLVHRSTLRKVIFSNFSKLFSDFERKSSISLVKSFRSVAKTAFYAFK